MDIIKTILGYPPMAVPESLKEWKTAITSVEQKYKSTESWHNYKTETGITFEGKEVPMNIGKSKDNFNKDVKPRCFDCNIYKHIAKEYQKPRKNKETRKCYKCEKVGYLAKDCRLEQKMKTRSIKEESDNEDDDNEKSFIKGLE